MTEAILKMIIVNKFRKLVKPLIEEGKVGDIEQFKANGLKQSAKHLEQAKADVQAQIDAYNQDKVARHAAAFKVADTNGDGSLNLAEAIAMLTPGEKMYGQFL